MYYALLNNDAQVLKGNLDAGGDVDHTFVDELKLNETPLHICCKKGHMECAQVISLSSLSLSLHLFSSFSACVLLISFQSLPHSVPFSLCVFLIFHSICLSVSLSLCMSVFLTIFHTYCLSVHLSVCLSISFSLALSHLSRFMCLAQYPPPPPISLSPIPPPLSLIISLVSSVFHNPPPHGLSQYLETGCQNRGFIDFCVSKVWDKVHTTNKINPIYLQILLF